MRVFLIIAIMGLMLPVISGIPVNAAGVLFEDNFNVVAAGAQPAGYTIEETEGKVEIAEIPSVANKSLYLNDPGAKVIKISRKFEPQTQVVVAELGFMQQVLGSTAKVIRLLDQNGENVAVQIETRSGGKLGYKTPEGAFSELGDYAAGQWYLVKVVANITTQKADVFVNGAIKLSQAPFLTQVANIGSFDSYTPGSSAKGHYLDDLKISNQ